MPTLDGDDAGTGMEGPAGSVQPQLLPQLRVAIDDANDNLWSDADDDDDDEDDYDEADALPSWALQCSVHHPECQHHCFGPFVREGAQGLQAYTPNDAIVAPAVRLWQYARGKVPAAANLIMAAPLNDLAHIVFDDPQQGTTGCVHVLFSPADALNIAHALRMLHGDMLQVETVVSLTAHLLSDAFGLEPDASFCLLPFNTALYGRVLSQRLTEFALRWNDMLEVPMVAVVTPSPDEGPFDAIACEPADPSLVYVSEVGSESIVAAPQDFVKTVLRCPGVCRGLTNNPLQHLQRIRVVLDDGSASQPQGVVPHDDLLCYWPPYDTLMPALGMTTVAAFLTVDTFTQDLRILSTALNDAA